MSEKWRLNEQEAKRILQNALLFLTPVAIVELELIQRGATLDELMIAFKVWFIGVLLDFFRKLQAGV